MLTINHTINPTPDLSPLILDPGAFTPSLTLIGDVWHITIRHGLSSLAARLDTDYQPTGRLTFAGRLGDYIPCHDALVSWLAKKLTNL